VSFLIIDSILFRGWLVGWQEQAQQREALQCAMRTDMLLYWCRSRAVLGNAWIVRFDIDILPPSGRRSLGSMLHQPMHTTPRRLCLLTRHWLVGWLVVVVSLTCSWYSCNKTLYKIWESTMRLQCTRICVASSIRFRNQTPPTYW
jgi:hypothetical protein